MMDGVWSEKINLLLALTHQSLACLHLSPACSSLLRPYFVHGVCCVSRTVAVAAAVYRVCY